MIENRAIEKEMKSSYLDYAMSVILSRAIPDVKDGLKPVQRRILYSMYEMGVTFDKPYRKSARIVGEVMGKYHPHGDSAIYSSLVRMGQEFSLRYPLIDGQGNFGCFTRDTKIRLMDGRDLDFEQLIQEDKEGKRNWTFGFNQEGNRIEVAEITNPRITRRNAELVEVTIDNGEKIRCTPDHRYLLRDGTYRQARNLQQGDSLMPLYTRVDDGIDSEKPEGSEMIYQPSDKEWQFSSALLEEWKLKHGVSDLSLSYPNFEGLQPAMALVNTDNSNGIVVESRFNNHKVSSVRYLPETEDVYDISIDNIHNFALSAGIFVHNSIDGDPPAAMRYTEARLDKISNEVLADIEYETVDFSLTFDGTLKEPLYLPSKIPNILLNGTSGIAVGMATNMPPHNLNEIIDGLIHLIKNKDAPVEDLIKIVSGPDFPTGGMILGRKGIIDAYRTGRGKIDLRARAEIEKNEIVFSEVPYEVNKSELLIKMAELSKEGVIQGISNIKDESNKDGIRMVIKVKNDFSPEVTLNQIYEHTQAQISYGIINLVLVNNVPRTLSLREIMREYLNHRELVVRRRTEFYLKKAREREHILEALIKALDAIDLTIKLIRSSKEVKDAREKLKKQFSFDDLQANAILETRLQKLTGMEISDLKKEMKEIEDNIRHYNDLLKNEGLRWDLITEELEEIKEKYGDSRKTEITDSYVETTDEELIPHEVDTIVLTEDNRISRIEADTFSAQKRGGKGVFTGTSESEIKQVITCDSHDRVFFFSDTGKVFQMKAYSIPKGERRSRAKLISAIFENMKGRIVFIMTKKAGEGKKYLLFVTEKGRVKKTEISQYMNIRSNGLIALKLRPGDLLKDVFVTTGDEKIALLSTDGRLVLVEEKEFRSMGRPASGVTGIRFKGDNKVASDATVITEELIVIAEKGLGKRVSVEDFSMRHRGAKGMRAIKVTERTGRPMYVSSIDEKDELLIITRNGKTIRTSVASIPQKGRNAQGVKLIELDDGDQVVSVTRIS